MHDTTDDQFPSQPELSDKLPRFRLIRKLSETKMSVIYLAEETDLGNRPVAVKVIAPMLSQEHSFRARFRDEILRTANLDHHNIVPVYFAQTDGELLYLVMPYVDGPNLRDLLKNGPLDLTWTVHMIHEVAAALDFAHAAGIVHRDVKPSNILVHRQSGRVLLCDFGIAAQALGERFTEVGRAGVGTPGFVAPELIPGGERASAPIDPRADVYSLGVVLYQCLTGRPPYAHSDVNALLWAQGHEDPPPVTMLRPELPKALDKVLATALAKRPQDRYATCLELADELALAVSGGRVRGVRRTPRRKVNWKPVAAITAAVAVAAAVTVLVVSTGGDSSTSPIFRVPPPLRGDCDTTAPSPNLAGAEETLLCKDGDRQVRFSLYADRSTMDNEYAGAVKRSGVAQDTGDCTVATGAEHRYPNGGDQTGRALCYAENGSTNLVWTNDEWRTIGESQTREADDQALAKAWTRWVGIPAFPTGAEKSLVDLVELDRCERTQAGTLASFRDLVAAVDCDPIEQGVTNVSYYQFSNVNAMRRTYDQHVDTENPPSGVLCADDPLPPNFLGNRSYDLRSVDLGSMLCYTDERGQPVLEWTVESLLVMVRATGNGTPDALVKWFDRSYGIPIEKVVDAANKKSRPPFPTTAETALLAHVPEGTRKNCMRPSAGQVKLNEATASTAGVVCGPSPGAPIVFYYQFPDATTMNNAYLGQQDRSGGDCLASPANFDAEAPYERGGDSGRLSCGSANNLHLIWTSNKFNIMVLAFQAWTTEDLLAWWQNGAGPA